MLPSRGLRWSSQSIGIGRRHFENRSFSSFRHHLLPPSTQQSSSSQLLLPHAHLRPRVVSKFLSSSSCVSAIRFQSTSPSKPNGTLSNSIPAGPEVTPDTTASSFDPSLFDLSSADLLNVPERIGYLKTLGLDYGWGPTSMMEWLLEHVHVYCGTPWWASITLTAILVRVILFKVYVNAADNAARLATVSPITKPLTKQMQAAQLQGNNQAVMRIRSELNRVHARAGIKLYRSFVPMLQVFVGYGTFVLLRGMAQLPVPGLETGGLLWFPNLAIPDPYLVLPIATAGLIHFAIRRGSDTGVNNMSPAVTRALAYGFPALSLLFTWWLPSGLQLSFLCTSLFTYLQSGLFRQPWAREFLGIHPLPKVTNDPFASKPEAPSPYQDRVVVVAKENYSSSSSSSSAGSSSSSSSRSGSGANVTYEAPRGTSEPDSKASGGLFGGMMKSAKDSFSNMQQSAAKTMKEMTNQKEGKRSKADQKAADRYEQQRQRQEAEKAYRLDEKRKAERLAKREAKQKQQHHQDQ